MKRFAETLFKYQQVLRTLASIELVIVSTNALPQSAELHEKMDRIHQIIRVNKAQEGKLDQEFQDISNRRSDIFPEFRLPKQFGPLKYHAYIRQL